MKGWISVHRKITENPMYFSEKFTRMQAWIDMLLIANHTEGYFYIRGNKVVVKRGQIGLGQDRLASRWQWSRGKVQRFLCELENSKQIVRLKNNVTTLISIVNYENYQDCDTTNRSTDGQQTDQQTDINNKNNKNNNENKNLYPFELFWNIYDKKIGKKDKIKKKWEKLSVVMQKQILEYLPKYIEAVPDKQFRKNPETFLNNEGWNDEIIERNAERKQFTKITNDGKGANRKSEIMRRASQAVANSDSEN